MSNVSAGNDVTGQRNSLTGDEKMANELSREEYRKNKMAESTQKEAVKKKKPDPQESKKQETETGTARRSRFPIWLRLIVIIVLMVVCLVVGAIIGYSVVGDGKAGDVFKKETWTHISDLINQRK
ncbi:DNA-directed RNA polymerase subunit beta [Fictibacillus fluitans]|uniref:DNA-directed RNA polymerase subunit beta n=1 Tax=Fictibacillus fluitans TaxID=3058422 RepID=A0ABT8HVP4_9BACL|nr:DNA-directed RNA polymerase subunit beta [Fictibacillus sp. NE201]MDN4524829.1 DNA-directed RNA polymerase subunit beta [Fictibacillus sp. NE201]